MQSPDFIGSNRPELLGTGSGIVGAARGVSNVVSHKEAVGNYMLRICLISDSM